MLTKISTQKYINIEETQNNINESAENADTERLCDDTEKKVKKVFENVLTSY